MPGTVSPPLTYKRNPLVSDPGMHHGMCITHMPRCMSGSPNCSGGENVPGIPCATRNFTYLARGPYQCWHWYRRHVWYTADLDLRDPSCPWYGHVWYAALYHLCPTLSQKGILWYATHVTWQELVQGYVWYGAAGPCFLAYQPTGAHSCRLSLSFLVYLGTGIRNQDSHKILVISEAGSELKWIKL